MKFEAIQPELFAEGGAFANAWADVDGDGDLDAIAVSYADGELAWFANDGEGGGWTKTTVGTTTSNLYAVAAGDVDGDGDVDLAVSNIDAPPTLLRNDSARRGAWLLVDAPGAVRVELRAGELRLVRHAVHGGSFCSASDERFHFGLGPCEQVDELTAAWPDGKRTTLADVRVDQVLRVTR